MTDEAKIGVNADFKRGDGQEAEAFATVGEVVDVVLPKFTADKIDATHSKSPGKYREFIKGLRQLEEFSLEIHYDSTSQNAADVFADFASDDPKNYQVVDADTSTFTFAAHVIGIEAGTPTADKQVMTVTFAPTGQPTMALATA
ncbi:phage tail tube protein [Pseudooceanicola sp. MF1-13]|uniref:phage tail tube protein n=1 Tax=Pseudooceanicola sp. MF1-13 TaxID=3379095 RepID=UPI0038917349